MKILQIITRLIVGGAQENTLLTCEGLHQRGHDVTLLTGPSLGPEGSLLPRALAGGYQVIEMTSMVRNPRPLRDALTYAGIRRICRKIKPDIVHTHSSKAGILARFAARHEHVPVIVHTIHGLPFHPYQSAIVNAAWIMLERSAASRCTAIVSVADAMTTQAVKYGIGRPEQYLTIHSGMDTAPFLQHVGQGAKVRSRLGIPADRLVLGTIARLQPLKGHDDLLTIAPKLLQQLPQTHFLWIGDGVFRHRFKQAIADHGWQSHFTFTGLVEPQEVAGLIPAMDILIHPSFREGLPRAVPQALLERIPVITYDTDGGREVCLPGKTGLLISPGDLNSLKAAIVTLASNPDIRLEMGQRGQQLCMKMFDAGTMVDKLEHLYQNLSVKLVEGTDK